MKKVFFALSVLALVAGFTAGCSKEQTNTEKLTGTWRLTAYEYDLGNDGSVDSTVAPLPCLADDDYTFAANGTLSVEYNTLCDPADPQTGSGTWSFADDETVLNSTYFASPLFVESLGADYLELSFVDGSNKAILHFHKP